MIYLSSVLCTPPEVIKEFNSLVFRFLWNGNDKVTRLSTYAPYDQGGLKMLDYDNMVKALRLSWLKRIVDPDYSGFWKSYLDHLLVNEGGLFLIQCNYDVNRLTILSNLLSRTIGLVVKIKRSQGSRKHIQVYFLEQQRNKD